MVFRVLAVFSHHNASISPQTGSQDEYSPQPFRRATNTPVGTLTGAEWQETSSCQHGVSQQSAGFCPCCNFPGPRLSVLGPPPETSQHKVNSVRRRKLRKVKPDYQRLRHEPPPPAVETIAFPRPESILSTHSRTPLLDPSRAANSTYAPRRIPNKLEKRDKIRKMASIATSSSFGFMALEAGNHELPHSSIEEAPTSQPIRSSSILGTEDLVSFTWTGEVQTENLAPSPSYPNSENSSLVQPKPRSRTKSDYSMRQRSSVLRKTKDVNAQKLASPRPWSLAMVLSDDRISDEKLVDQLEDMRLKELSQRRRCLSVSCPSPTYQVVLNDSYAEYPPDPDEFVPEDSSGSSWNTAKHALLICREMLRTERRYLFSLRILAKGGTATFPPLTLLYHLPRLITASEEFLQLMTRNPSVRGVSEAFLATKEKFDEAFVYWCSDVGTFFADDGGKARSDSEDSSDQTVTKLRRTASTPVADARNSVVDNVVIIEPNKIRRNSKKRPSVRELAILPTQRIVRYVLLFKELSTLTPAASSSSFVVAQALHAAQIIAKHADGAQAHAAFIAPS